ncbi:MAG: polyprenyl diphosphate synthase [Candidatus Pacebacteria bacterium]|nr:polyprenyl diphosphate synthase [Candidatus Paceibacterota bacterium]
MEKKIKNYHIALIPDGNRRWARKRGFQPWIGHQAGAQTFSKILDKALEMRLHYFTFWGASFDNLTKRSKMEVKFLYKIMTERFKKAAGDERMHKNKVRVNVLGRWEEIAPDQTKKAIKNVIEKTKDYSKYFLTFLIGYNGTDEMISCIKNIADLVKKGSIPSDKINEKVIQENLWTNFLPPVDLVIRTGCEGDPHNSAGFMMWQTAYSQLYFTKTFFPSFSAQKFEEVIKDFERRERRMGS